MIPHIPPWKKKPFSLMGGYLGDRAGPGQNPFPGLTDTNWSGVPRALSPQYDHTMGAGAGPRTPGKKGWDKDLLGEVLKDIMGNVDTTPLPGQRVGETNIGELSLLQQAGPEVGDISTSMDRFWKKKLGYA